MRYPVSVAFRRGVPHTPCTHVQNDRLEEKTRECFNLFDPFNVQSSVNYRRQIVSQYLLIGGFYRDDIVSIAIPNV